MSPIRSNADEEIARLGQVATQAGSLLADAIALAADDAVETLRAETPVDSGALRDAWTAYPTADGAVIANPLPYADIRGPNPAQAFPSAAVEVAVRARLDRLLE